MNEEEEYKEILVAMLKVTATFINSKCEQALKHAILGDLDKAMETARGTFDQLKCYANDIDDVARFISDTSWRSECREQFACFVRRTDKKMAESLRIGIALRIQPDRVAEA